MEHAPSRGAPRISRGSLSYHSTLTHDGSSLIIANGDDASMDLYMLSADDLSIQNRHSATPSPDYDERIGTHFSYCRNELVCGTRTGDFEWKPAPKRAFKVNDCGSPKRRRPTCPERGPFWRPSRQTPRPKAKKLLRTSAWMEVGSLCCSGQSAKRGDTGQAHQSRFLTQPHAFFFGFGGSFSFMTFWVVWKLLSYRT